MTVNPPTVRHARSRRTERGSTLFEFALSAVVLLMVIFGIVEMARLALVANAIANAARAGVRYAIVHGSDDAVAASAIQTVVKNFAGTAPLNINNLTVTVTYVDTATTPGSRVEVKVTYPYDPFMTYYTLSTVKLGSVSRGVIVF